MKINSIGLSEEKSISLARQLNILLADFQRYYQNLRRIHWNIRRKSFFDLHVNFEELYNDANLKADEIAEVQILEEQLMRRFQRYKRISESQHNRIMVV